MAKKTKPRPTKRDIKAAEKLIKSNVIQSILERNARLNEIIQEESAKHKQKVAKEMMPIRVSKKKSEDPIEKLKQSIDGPKKSKSAKEAAKTLKKSEFEPLEVKTTPLSGKSAQESAEVLLPKEAPKYLPTTTDYATKKEKRLFDALLKKAQAEIGSSSELPVIEATGAPLKSAKESAEVLSKIRDVTPPLSNKSAREAADVLAPKELPVPAGEVITRKDVSDILPRETTTRTSTATPDITPEYRALEEGTDIVPTSTKGTALVPRGVKQAAKSLGSGVSKLVTKGAPIVGAGLDIYDVYSALKEDDYRKAAGSAGSALGSLGGGALGGFGGPVSAVAGSYAGSQLGEKVGSSFYEYLSDPKKRDVVLGLLASGETGFGSAAEKLGDLVQSENKASVSALKQRPDSDYKVPERPTPLLPVDEKEEEPTTLPSAGDVKFEDEEEEEEFDVPFNTPSESPTDAAEDNKLDTSSYSSRIKSEEDADYVTRGLSDARKQRDLAYLASAIGKAGGSIGSGISGLAVGGVPTKPEDSGIFDLLQKYSESKVDDVKEDYILKQKQLQSQSKIERDDPNSSISKSAQQTLLKFAPNLTQDQVSNLSYNQIKELQLARAGIQTSALQQKGELATKAQEQKVALAEAKTSEAKQKAIRTYYQTENDRTRRSPEYQYLGKLNSATKNLEDAVLNPSGIKDISSIFSFMKFLDPNSAVRPSEIELTKEAMSAWATLDVALSKYSPSDSPKVLDEKTKRDMLALVKAYNSSAQDSYKRIIKSKAEVLVEAFGAEPEQAYRLLDVEKLLPDEEKPLLPGKEKDATSKPEAEAGLKKTTTSSGLNIYE